MVMTGKSIFLSNKPAVHLTWMLVCLILLLPITISASDEILVQVTLDQDTIGMDEQAMLTVEVSGSMQNLPAPRMPTLSMFEVYSQGRSSNISIINGQVTSSVTYRYLLMPTRPGTYPIDQIAVVHNNKRHRGNGVKLTVIKSGTSTAPKLEKKATDNEGKSKDYFLTAEIDKKNPFVNEQVTLTLKFYIRVQYYGGPELTEPSTTGFWTEVLGTRGAYFQVINNRKYKVIERKYALFPTQAGELTIGKASIKTSVAAKRQTQRDPFNLFDDFFGRSMEATVHSNPIKVEVKPLPDNGRPGNFTGTIGSFNISAQADKKQVEVNQPVTVTYRLSGTGNVKSVAEPVIPEMDEFRVYTASTKENMSKQNDKLGGTKIYEKVFIPKRPGEFEIPAVVYNYFEPGSKQYKTITTRPIKIKVIKPEGYVASVDQPYTSPDLTIGSEAKDIHYIKDNIGEVVPGGRLSFLTPLYFGVNGIPVLALAVMVLLRRRREKLAGNIGLARSRAASKMAKKRLEKAKSLADVKKAVEFYAEIHLALISYIADKLNISPHGLTTDSISELLIEKGANSELVDKIIRVVKSCDFARFAPASLSQSDLDESLRESEDIMVRLEGIKFE